MSKIGKNLTAIKKLFCIFANPHRNLVIRKDRKLSDEQVILIKRAIKEGLTGKEISQKYNFANYKNIYAIKKGLSYKLVKDNTEVI